MDIYVALFYRYFLALVVMLPWLLPSGGAALKTQRLGLHIGRALLMVIHGGTLMVAVTLIPLAEATSLIFTSPLFATGLAALFLREVVGPHRIFALVLAFNLASGLMLVSAFTGASVVVTGKVLLRTESAEKTVFYLTLFAVPFALMPALYFWQWPSLEQYFWLFMTGVLSSVAGLMFAKAYQVGEVTAVAPMSFSRLIFAAIVGFVFFSEIPEIWVWAGGAVIIYLGRIEARLARVV